MITSRCVCPHDAFAFPLSIALTLSRSSSQSTNQSVTYASRTATSFLTAASASGSANIFNVHSTISNQGSAAAPQVIVSFSMGTPTIGTYATVWPSGTPPVTGVSGAFAAASAPAGMVWLSTTSKGNGAATSAYSLGPFTAFAIQYLRNYTGNSMTQDPAGKMMWGVPNTFVYLSAPLYHATVTGLAPATRYYYVVGSSSATSLEFSFITPPAPSTAATYPFTLGLIADVGQTINTSTTMLGLAQQNVNLLLVAGDLVYADNHNHCNLTANYAQSYVANGVRTNVPAFWPGTNFLMYPEPAGLNAWHTCQLKWDSWLSVPGLTSLFGSTAAIVSAGNHEIERTVANVGTDMAQPNSTYSNFQFANGDYLYQAYAARFPNGAQTPTTPSAGGYGDINSAMYWSQNTGPVHTLVLNSLLPFGPGTPQYAFIQSDLAAASAPAQRALVPWIIVMFHMPIYHTYEIPWKSCECVRTAWEPLFAQYGVDFVLNGHVHSYERTHPTLNYTTNAAGPVWLMLGDGGNAEGMAKLFIDQTNPLTGNPLCYDPSSYMNYSLIPTAINFAGERPTLPWGRINATLGVGSNGVVNASIAKTWKYGPGYQRQVNPLTCNAVTFQPGPGYLPNPVIGGGGGYFCPSSQPAWSAFRDPSYGYGTLKLTGPNTATYGFFRTIDGPSTGNANVAIDMVSYTRVTSIVAAPSPPPAVATVSASMTLAGVTVAQFSQAAQTAFIATLASQLSVSASAISITSIVSATPSGRHLLQSGITVAFSVTAASTTAATTISTAVTTITTGTGATTFVTALNSNLATAGLTSVVVTSESAAVAPTVVAAPASSPAVKPQAAALGVAALLLAVLLAF